MTLLDIDEIPLEASSDTLRAQIEARREFLPRITVRELVVQMHAEIQQLTHRLERRG
jgi:hypothetical protein